MGKKLLSAMVVLGFLLCAGVALSQEAAPAPAADPSAAPAAAPEAAPAAAGEAVDADALAEELARDRQRMERAKQDLTDRKRELTDELAQIEAKEKQAQQEIPDAQRAADSAQKDEQVCYDKMIAIGSEYAAAEQKERDEFKTQILSDLNAKNQAEYDEQLAKHNKDMAFIEANRWRREDLVGLTLAMDDEDAARVLKFSATGDDLVSGQFWTVDFASGKTVWHDVPGDASFSVTVHGDNPFVADVVIHPGSDVMGINATNVLDWDIHVYVAKLWNQAGGGIKLSGMAWPADIGRKMSRMVMEPPVFVPTQKPELKTATEETPEIKVQLDAWKFANPGWIQKLEDSKGALKNAKHVVKVTKQMIIKTENRSQNKLADLAEEKKKLEVDIADVDAKLRDLTESSETSEDVDLSEAGTEAPAAGGSLGANEF